MTTEEALLASLHADPRDPMPRLALADALEERDRLREAELMRCQFRLDTADPGDRSRRRFETRVQALLAEGVRPLVPLLTLELKPGVPLQAALILPGSFYMGTTRNETTWSDKIWRSGQRETPRRRVTLTRPFYLGIYPVTQAQWQALIRDLPSRFRGADRPVECVVWNRAVEFCRRATRKRGRTVRLPTEAEWEYGCRAGTQTAYASGNDEQALERVGWFQREDTQPVGRKQPNGWGLHDMHGNVWEWCQDAPAKYPNSDRVDPVHAIESQERIARGGSYSNPHGACRSGCRIGFMAGGANDFIGFRVAIDW
jgi:uncharacterized protein (TIGR02996 family)